MPSAREKKAAHAFAARAVPDRPYYIVQVYREHSNEMRGRKDSLLVLEEIVFKAATPSSKLLNGAAYPRWYGPHTAADCYLYHNGQIFEDRHDPAIAGMRTNREMRAYLDELQKSMLSSDEWHKELNNIASASGTRFRARR